MAGIIPGLCVTLGYMIVIFLWCTLDPKAGPKVAKSTLKETLIAIGGCVEILIVIASIVIGISTGWCTASEAAGLAALLALILAILRKRLSWQTFVEACKETLKGSGMVFMMLIAASLLTTFVALTELPEIMVTFVESLHVPRMVVMIVISIIFLFLGCVMDTPAINAIFIPIFYPLVAGLGFDLIWFGIYIVRMCEIGMITPPIGINAFIVSGFTKRPLKTVFKGSAPFLISDLVNVALLLAVPQLALILPGILF